MPSVPERRAPAGPRKGAAARERTCGGHLGRHSFSGALSLTGETVYLPCVPPTRASANIAARYIGIHALEDAVRYSTTAAIAVAFAHHTIGRSFRDERFDSGSKSCSTLPTGPDPSQQSPYR